MNQHSGQGSPNYGDSPCRKRCGSPTVTFYCRTGFRHLLDERRLREIPQAEVHPHRERLWLGRRHAEALDRIHMGFVHGAIGEMNYKGMEWVLKDKAERVRSAQLLVWRELSEPGRPGRHRRDRQEPRAVGQRLSALRRHVPVQHRIAAAHLLGHARDAAPQVARRERGKAVQLRSGKAAAARRAVRADAIADQHAASARRDPRDSTCYLFQNALFGI